jgi:hypothetical protein
MVGEYGEGQVDTYRADGLGAEKDWYEASTEGPSWPKDLLWWVTLRDINKQEDM